MLFSIIQDTSTLHQMFLGLKTCFEEDEGYLDTFAAAAFEHEFS